MKAGQDFSTFQGDSGTLIYDITDAADDLPADLSGGTVNWRAVWHADGRTVLDKPFGTGCILATVSGTVSRAIVTFGTENTGTIDPGGYYTVLDAEDSNGNKNIVADGDWDVKYNPYEGTKAGT